MPASLELPPLLAADRLADSCREAAAEARVQPAMVEKDYYLTRLIWALAQELEDRALLKGGTLLSKVDLEFRRMSEDVDLVLPGAPDLGKRQNALRMNSLRAALSSVADAVGVTLGFPHGERTERDAHVQWKLDYVSRFGPQQILVEASLRPVLLRARRAPLKQLLSVDGVADAHAWALDEAEARAEKVRAAFTRRAIRDYYDLDALADAGKDFSSKEFVRLVDAKLGELDAAPLALQGPEFGMQPAERSKLSRAAREELRSVLRVDAPSFDLDRMLARFDAAWEEVRAGR